MWKLTRDQSLSRNQKIVVFGQNWRPNIARNMSHPLFGSTSCTGHTLDPIMPSKMEQLLTAIGADLNWKALHTFSVLKQDPN